MGCCPLTRNSELDVGKTKSLLTLRMSLGRALPSPLGGVSCAFPRVVCLGVSVHGQDGVKGPYLGLK